MRYFYLEPYYALLDILNTLKKRLYDKKNPQ